MTKRKSRVALALLASLTVVQCAAAQVPTVGTVRFDNSGAAAAQQDFLTGLAQLHNFEYGAAAALFRSAQQTDPGFAMAFWGEAMTYNHAVWMEQDLEAARGVLARLGATPAARLAKAPTEREKDYLRALDILYGEGDKEARDRAYAEAMVTLAARYRDDVDAAALAALALLGTAHGGRDVAVYLRAAAMLEPLFQTHPSHPGLAHYLIHSYDDPVHAPRGLAAARAYSKIAPAAAHAQHMCSHIFVAMGMWDEVAEANEAAVKLTADGAAPNRPPATCGHYPFWLMYGYLQQGRRSAAKDMVVACHRAAVGRSGPAWTAFAAMRSRYLIDTEEWTGEVAAMQVAGGPPEAQFTYEFANAFAAVRLGDLPAARAALGRMTAARQAIAATRGAVAAVHAGMKMPPRLDGEMGRLQIMRDEIGVMIGGAEGAPRDASKRLYAIAAAEDGLPYEFGPPAIDKPVWELLGEALLAVAEPQDARAAFEKALNRTPGRTAALVGLMKAAAMLGDQPKEAEIKARLDAIWHRADARATTGKD